MTTLIHFQMKASINAIMDKLANKLNNSMFVNINLNTFDECLISCKGRALTLFKILAQK